MQNNFDLQNIFKSLDSDERFNKLDFSELDEKTYEFKFDDLKLLEVVKSTIKHDITRYLHIPSNINVVAKSFRIPANTYRDVEKIKEEMNWFKKESDILMKLKNPHIISFYGLCLHEHKLLLFMESMDFSLHDLYTFVHEKGDLFPEKIIGYIVISISDALHYCEDKKILHRDIKPTNIFINKKGHIKLGDFGESRFMSDEMASMAGTLSYLPPERLVSNLSGGKYDSLSDVWSVGITLIEMLYGKLPFMSTIYGDLYEYYKDYNESKKNELIEKCLRRYPSLEIRDFISSCLSDVDKRPHIHDLQMKKNTSKRESLYQKFKKVNKETMDQQIAIFLDKYQDRWFKPLNALSEEISRKQEYLSVLESKVSKLKNEYETIKKKSSGGLLGRVMSLIYEEPRTNSDPKKLNDFLKSLMSDPTIGENLNRLIFPYSTEKEFTFDVDELSVVEEIGCTNNTTVKKYLHKPTKKELVIKAVILPYSRNSLSSENEKLIKSIRREIENAIRLSHIKEIVYYYGFCLYDNSMWFCMEAMNLSLQDVYLEIHKTEHTKFPEKLIGCIIVSMVSALAECHKANILHRNVKPSNIFFKYPDLIKLGDFFESGLLENSLSTTYGGNVWYWPPEAFTFNADDLDNNTQPGKRDVWGLGITLVECVKGHIPYKTDKNKSDNIIVVQNLIQKFDASAAVGQTFKEYSTECHKFILSCLQAYEKRKTFSELQDTFFYKKYSNVNVKNILKDAKIFNKK